MTGDELPDRRRYGYAELEKKLNDDVGKIQDRARKFFIGAIIGFSVIGVSSGIAILGFGVVLRQQGNTSNKIQQQRYNSLLDSCLDQNVRHDNVLHEIDEAVEKTPRKRRKQAEEGAKPFKLILEAAVPYTSDCRKYAQVRVSSQKAGLNP